MRKFKKFEYDGNMDKECFGICDAMNSLPGIQTFESCCGHGAGPFSVWFKVTDPRGLFFLTRCVDHRYWKYGYLWKIELSVGDVMNDGVLPTHYRLTSGPIVGEDAYAQARELYRNMTLHLNHEAFLQGFYGDDRWYDEMGDVGWKEKLLTKYSHMLPADGKWPIRMFSIEHGDGWRGIVEGLFAHIDNLVKEHGSPPVLVHQIKEKFGAMCFYYEGGDDKVQEAVRDAEHAAWYTCELCGSTEDIGRTQGWITTCCRKCHETCDNERVRAREWKPVEHE